MSEHGCRFSSMMSSCNSNSPCYQTQHCRLLLHLLRFFVSSPPVINILSGKNQMFQQALVVLIGAWAVLSCGVKI